METEAQRGEVAYVGKWQGLHWNWGQTDTRACALLKSHIASPLPLECPHCCPFEDTAEERDPISNQSCSAMCEL